MILGTETKTVGRRLARYIAGLVLVVLERDGALTAKALEPAVAAAFDAHGLKLARDAKCPTATAAAARWVPTVCRELCGAGFIHNVSVGAERWVLNAKRVRFDSPADAADALKVGRTSVRRWVERWMIAQAPTGRVSVWRGHLGEFFPARAPLPKQGELELPAEAPTDDDLARAETASVNMVEPEAPNPDAAGPFDVVLLSAGRRKIHAIKAFMDVNNPRPSLRLARDAVESAPVIVRRNVDGVIASAVVAEFERIGATAKAVMAGTWSAPAPETPWTVTTCETARFEADGVVIEATRGEGGPTVRPVATTMTTGPNAAVRALRFARMLEAASLWALGES